MYMTMTAYNRLDTLEYAISTIFGNSLIDKFNLIINMDPSERTEEIKEFLSFYNLSVNINPERLGCNGNTIKSMNFQADRQEYVIHLEDDIVYAKDFLEFISFCMKNHFNIGSGYRSKGNSDRSNPNKVIKQGYFYPWGFCIKSSFYNEHIRSKLVINTPRSWDSQIHDVLKDTPLFEQYIPALSRTSNIGAIEGQHVPDRQWHYKNQWNPDSAVFFEYDYVKANEFIIDQDVSIGFETPKDFKEVSLTHGSTYIPNYDIQKFYLSKTTRSWRSENRNRSRISKKV
jgi:hypothetical protein